MTDKDANTPKPHSQDDEAPEALQEDDEHGRRRRHDELLDEGVEETFPASDPVAVKHIT